MGHILQDRSHIRQQKSLNKFKTEIISCISHHNCMSLKISFKKKAEKNVESKQHVTKQPMGHWKKIRGPKMPGDKSGTITFQNQCVGAKAVLRGKSIAIKAYLIWKKSQVSNLILHLKKKKTIKSRTNNAQS